MTDQTIQPDTVTTSTSAISGRDHLLYRCVSWAIFVAVVGGWELWLGLRETPAHLLPKPSEIVFAIIEDLRSGVIYPHVWATLASVVAGFIGAVLIGVGIGSAVALLPPLERIVYPYIVIVQIIPKIAIAPLIIIWLGYGIGSIAAIVALVAFFPVLVNVIAGLKSADANKIMLMRSFGSGRWDIFTYVRVPSALPYFFAGLDVAIVFSVIGAVVGEFIGAPEGLGSLIVQRQYSMNVAGVFSAIVFLAVMGIVLHLAVKLAARHIAFWNRAEQLYG